jgi:hypothetical protein
LGTTTKISAFILLYGERLAPGKSHAPIYGIKSGVNCASEAQSGICLPLCAYSRIPLRLMRATR